MTTGTWREPDDPLMVAEAWMAEGRKVALATVIQTWGSAPRPIGSQLVIDANGNFQGSVSGGCVEGAVVSEAVDVIASGAAHKLEFAVADETAWQVGLSCGGQIHVYVERLGSATDPGTMKILNDERRARRAAILVTDLGNGDNHVVKEGAVIAGEFGNEIARTFRTGRSNIIEIDGRSLFLNVQIPPPRIVIIGAVHISQALAPMARLAGFDVEIVDPRTAFATQERFPDVELHAEWPQDVLARRPFDAFTALAALTHDPKIDDFPLQAALDAQCFYVGALGSRKTHAKRVDRLLAAGVAPADIQRIDAPIGLDIAASSTAEIAVAVLAQIIQALRTRGLDTEQRN